MRVCVCACVRVCVCACVHTCMRICMFVCARTCLFMCMQVRSLLVRACESARVYVYMSVNSYERANVRLFVNYKNIILNA